MAKPIDRVGSRLKYPWKEWTNGKAYRASKGEDFDVEPESFASSLRKRASRKGLRVQVRVLDKSVEFQFSRRSPTRRSPSPSPQARKTKGAK